MIEHIVLFKWQENTPPEKINQVLQELKALENKIPGIINLSCGENFSARNQGFQHGLIVQFADYNSLEAYFPHPEHQNVVNNYIKPIIADILSIDYSHI